MAQPTVNSLPAERYTLITGGSSGIGRAFAEECASRGHNLFLIDLPGTGLQELSPLLSESHGIKVKYYETDLTKPESFEAVLKHATNHGIEVNFLINNVGKGHNGTLESLNGEQISAMIRLNILTTTLLTHEFIPMLKSNAPSYILNLSSFAAFTALPGKSVYSASKAYVLYFTKSIRTELKPFNIKVAAVCPAGVPTSSIIRERIKKSSKIARSLVCSADQVAKNAIDGVIKGKSVIFPGHWLKTFYACASFIPQGLIIKILGKEIKRAPQ
jgi:short-subunit dehydrogenase